MALSGACPGTLFAQIGSGVSTAFVTAVGAFLGSITYGYLDNYLSKTILPGLGAKSPIETLDSTFHLEQEKSNPANNNSSTSNTPLNQGLSHTQITSMKTILLLPAIYILSQTFPWRQDLTHLNIPNLTPSLISNLPNLTFNPSTPAWNPIVGGIVIGGIAQTLSILLNATPLGASSFYPFMGAHVVSRLDKNWESRAPVFKTYLKQSETIYIAIGTILGAYISALMGGGNLLNGVASSSSGFLGMSVIVRSVLGGVFLIWGSRIAGGCPSGHGISGMGQLSVASYVTVVFMFVGGILTALMI
jgi:uncharacterized membrane protein YedE/YeeE